MQVRKSGKRGVSLRYTKLAGGINRWLNVNVYSIIKSLCKEQYKEARKAEVSYWIRAWWDKRVINWINIGDYKGRRKLFENRDIFCKGGNIVYDPKHDGWSLGCSSM